MRRNIKLLWLMFFLVFVAQRFTPAAWSQNAGTISLPKEPEGFRGIRWGQKLSETPSMIYVRSAERAYEGWTSYWVMDGEKLSIGPIECTKIEYSGYGDLFYSVTIIFNGEDAFLMAQVFEKLYGYKPHMPVVLGQNQDPSKLCCNSVQNEWKWEGEQTEAVVREFYREEGERTHMAIASLTHKKLYEKCQRTMMDEIKKDKADMVEQALKDM
ncbi:MULTISPECIES: hypothetical protein [Aminobacterium]|uniref:hypothetical protein n=1 Tax=Aminobacterium TaxID=81466 RepID=UPI00257D3178|nr:hypothetical protein [Aminobacterium sp. UBA4987]